MSAWVQAPVLPFRCRERDAEFPVSRVGTRCREECRAEV